MENETIKCEVALDRIFYPKHATHVESGTYAIFSAMVIKTIEGKELKKIKLKGNVPKLVYGATYRVYATLAERNPQYGDTYEITYMSKKLDISSKDKQKEFLSNILSERQVENLFDMYDDVLKLLDERDVEALCKVKGIKSQTALKIIDTYEDSKDYSAIYLELGKLGLTNNMIKKLMEFYRSPDTVIDKVRNNPYELVNINGIGFKKADEIAQKVGIDKYDIRRIGGYITHVLIEQGESGRSYLMYQELMKAIYDTLGFIPEDIMKSVATTMMKQGNIVVDMNGERIALKRYYNLEKRISEELMRLMNGEREYNKPDDIYTKYIPKEFTFNDTDEKIESIEKEQGFEFTDEQRDGILLMKNNNVIAITGSAGCGKSATANGIVNLFDNANVMACALSGKASVRITEATGLQASTIHRLLGWQADGTFLHNRNYPLECDLIVIDEATMINGTLFLQLLQAIPSGAKVIIMGDVQQLTPIGNCQVFADILNSNIVTSVKLTKPHRQALRSGIIPTSMSIASQQQIFKNKFTGKTILGELQDMVLDIHNKDCALDDLVLEYLKEELASVGNVMDVQVCVAMKLRGCLSCYNLNTKIQQYYNPIENYNGNKIEIVLDAKNKDDIKKYTIIERDKVINVVNNYRAVTLDGANCPIFNGNIGIVNVIYEDGSCEVEFEGIGVVVLSAKDSKNLELAYALTSHKCLPEDTYIYTNKGIKQLKDLNNGANIGEFKAIEDEIKVYNGIEFEQPKSFYNAGVSTCKTFTTKKGYKLTCTLEHGLDVLCEDGYIHRKQADDITENDYLVLRKGNESFGNNCEIPKEWSDFQLDVRSKIYNLPTTITKDFAKFLGMMVADGTICKCGIKFGKNQKDTVEEFGRLVKEIFGYDNINIVHKLENGAMGGMYLSEVSSRQISEFCRNIDGIQPHDKFIPDCIMNSTKENVCAFLQGVFEDGTVNVKREKFDHIELTLKGGKICEQIKLLLLNLGIVCTTMKTKGREDTYSIYIYKRDAVMFEQNINFICDKKRKRLELCNVKSKNTQCNYTIPYIYQIIDSLRNKYKLSLTNIDSHLNSKIKHKSPISLDSVIKFLNGTKDIIKNDSDYDYLKSLIDDLQIEPIKTIEFSEKHCYCLEMPMTHKFVQNGFVGWNCQGSGFTSVIVAIDGSSYIMNNSELLYTGVTRAKKKCSLIGDNSIIRKTINTKAVNTKQTYLKEMLLEHQNDTIEK